MAKPAIVFLHAFPLGPAMWRPQMDALSGSFRCLTPAMPGFAGRPFRGAGIDDWALDVVEQVLAAGVESAVFVGLSMGGYVAFRLAELAPAMIAGLVICDTKAEADGPEAVARRESAAERALAEGIGWVPDAMLPQLITGSSMASDVGCAVRSMILECTPQAYAAAQKMMMGRPDSLYLLPRLTMPCATVCGEFDAITTPDSMAALAMKIPGQGRPDTPHCCCAVSGCRHYVVPGAGHLSNMENPRVFNEAVIRVARQAFGSF